MGVDDENPGPPDWYPDPWNGSMLRWWDGTQWGAHTAPAGQRPPPPTATGIPDEFRPPSADAGSGPREPETGWKPPPGPSTAPAAAPVPHATGGTRPPAGLIVAGVAVVLAVVVIAVVVASSGSGSSPRATHQSAAQAAASTLPPITTTTLPAFVPLSEGVLTASDLGGGWAVRTAAATLPTTEYTAGPCSSPLWKTDVAGWQSHFANGGGGDVRSGLVDSEVFEAASTADATAQAGFVTSSGWVPCIKLSVFAELEAEFNDTSLDISQLSADPLNLSTSLAGAGYALSVDIVDSATGDNFSVTDDNIELFSGPYMGEIDIVSTSDQPLNIDQMIQTDTTALATRLAALPPQGTIAARST